MVPFSGTAAFAVEGIHRAAVTTIASTTAIFTAVPTSRTIRDGIAILVLLFEG
ncbi:hypothetical protein GCM10027436_73240 [Actinophytocola sediminis]